MNIKTLFTDVQQHSLQESDQSPEGKGTEGVTSPHAVKLKRKRLPQKTSRSMMRQMLRLIKPLKKFKKPQTFFEYLSQIQGETNRQYVLTP